MFGAKLESGCGLRPHNFVEAVQYFVYWPVVVLSDTKPIGRQLQLNAVWQQFV